ALRAASIRTDDGSFRRILRSQHSLVLKLCGIHSERVIQVYREKFPALRVLLSMRSWLLLAVVAAGLRAETKAEYAGGTDAGLTPGVSASLDLADNRYLAIYTRRTQLRIAYAHINLLEYGQKVDRRIALAIAVSPAFLASKSRKHFLTIG